MNRIVEVLPDSAALIQRALEIVLGDIRSAIADRGRCTIALAGGSTPKPLYEQIATQDLPWDAIHVFWGDERYVSADHPDSNQGMARRAWLDKVPIPPGNIHPIPTDEADPALAANKHEAELQEFFQVPVGVFPAFDIILLGIGDDGHTASLFPHTQALQVQDRLVTVGNKDNQPRITFTASLINHARSIVFIVAGAGKRAALEQIFAPTGDATVYPARLVQPQGNLWWLLDGLAGQDLNA